MTKLFQRVSRFLEKISQFAHALESFAKGVKAMHQHWEENIPDFIKKKIEKQDESANA